MSGIAGAIDDAARETVRRATAAMTHRDRMVIGACQAARMRSNGSAPQLLAGVVILVINWLRRSNVHAIAAILREDAWNLHRLFTSLGRWND